MNIIIRELSLDDYEEYIKLINYLFKNKHTSPFEMVKFKFHVKAPIFVARQWFRHRTGNYNEISGTFSTNGHSATLIPVFAYGPGSEAFSGVYENTEIFYKILEATKWNTKN